MESSLNSNKLWGFKVISNYIEFRSYSNNSFTQKDQNIVKLAHYSSSRKGSACYYQQIYLNKVQLSKHILEYYNTPRVIKKFIFQGSDALSSQKYHPSTDAFAFYLYNLTINGQLRHNVTTSNYIQSMVNNTNTDGYKSSYRTGSQYALKRGFSVRGGSFQNFSRWGALRGSMLPLLSNLDSNYRNRVFSNNLTVKSSIGQKYTKSFNSLYSIWNKNNFEFSIWSSSILNSISNLFTSIVYFIRTIWFKVTHQIRSTLEIKNQGEFGIKLSNRLLRLNSNLSSFSNSNEPTYYTTALTLWDDEYIDPSRLSKSPTSSKKRRFFNRKHFTFRIGLGFWGKKLWQFKKSRNFWNYIRSLYTYMFRAFKSHYAFQNRLDVFILRFFSVRTILYARSLIKAGHVFVGSFNPRNPMYQVQRHGIVSLSKKALIWTSCNNKTFLNTFNSDKTEELKSVRRMQKTSALRYARQQKDLYMFGEAKYFKYAMFYGDDLHILSADNKKTKFFSLSYFYAQKVINSAWW